MLNLRGSDILYGQFFHAYLFVGLHHTILFVDPAKLHDEVVSYLHSIEVKHRHYKDLWLFLRRREWGEGRVLISPQTSYAISLVLTRLRCTAAPSYVDHMISVKNETEIEGMRRAYHRDGVAFVSNPPRLWITLFWIVDRWDSSRG